MSGLKFRPPLKISVYITLIQYLILVIFLPIVFKLIAWDTSIWKCLLIPIVIIIAILFTHSAIDLISVDLGGLIGYSWGQFSKTNHSLKWSEIYQVKPYKYFGLQFLLVRYHGSDTPLWFPLFLKKQHKLNLAILKQTRHDNPLHTALLQLPNFEQVPWYGRVKKHKSDRYILENCYVEKIKFSFLRYCWFLFTSGVIFCLPMYLLLAGLRIDRDCLIMTGIPFLFLIFVMLLMWYLGFKNNYIAIKDNSMEIGIEFLRQQTKHNIPLSEITKVKYSNYLVIKDLQVFSLVPLYGMSYTPIRLSLINTHKFKTAILKKIHPEHPLYEAAIRYL